MKREQENYLWGHKRRFNDFATHFKKQFSQRVQKISVDAGFTCPNRDGTVGLEGCTYCNNTTFKPGYCRAYVPIKQQLDQGISFFDKKYNNISYMAYFQAYTNTHAPLEELTKIYDEAIGHPRVIGLVIATRPDCLPDDILDYLEELSGRTNLVVELGLESCLNRTLMRINRGHTFEQSAEAILKLHQRKINLGVHLILGLPGESRGDIINQAAVVSELQIGTLKLHQLQIHRNTAMEQDYVRRQADYRLFYNVDDYVDLVVEYLERLNPKIVMERFISQAPKNLLIAPKWGLKNFEFVHKLENELKRRDTWQGRLYKK